MGYDRVPAWKLLGADRQKVILFDNSEHQIFEDRIGAAPISTGKGHPVLYPRNPKAAFRYQEGWIVVSSMVTVLHCQDCACAYFHFVDRFWDTQNCFGEGKNFENSFMKSDFPLPFWWPEKEIGGIFYSRSKDLYFYSKDGKETITATLFAQDPPDKSQKALTTDGERVLLTARSSTRVAVFALEKNVWQQVGDFKGEWAAALPLAGHIILVNNLGNIETPSISYE
jgi:hypothetical protein